MTPCKKDLYSFGNQKCPVLQSLGAAVVDFQIVKTSFGCQKSSQKVLDPKKDCLSRLKHLRIVLENSDTSEAKAFFESNYSHIYYIFYDVFISAENNLKQRAHQRTAREDLEIVRFIFEKLLILLPELINSQMAVSQHKENKKNFFITEIPPSFAEMVSTQSFHSRPNSSHSHGFLQQKFHFNENYQETSTFYANTTDVPEAGFSCTTNLFAPVLDLPMLRRESDMKSNMTAPDSLRKIPSFTANQLLFDGPHILHNT
ncbi:ral GTPase-activating protein subunit alpha-2 [Caerostris extrusa]|uniref:Ral GTPase-activating protein subunit alpha-2 n=1 Tax=Caerostris extrusa TaxID=172846 RepID=A0AAV4S105_CAEEX|nr:ral GTPase-activating protein subunit alpha-2 [Caerostris extrusa]